MLEDSSKNSFIPVNSTSNIKVQWRFFFRLFIRSWYEDWMRNSCLLLLAWLASSQLHSNITWEMSRSTTNRIISYSDQPFYWTNKFALDRKRNSRKKCSEKTWIKINKPSFFPLRILNHQACCLFIMIHSLLPYEGSSLSKRFSPNWFTIQQSALICHPIINKHIITCEVFM